MNSRFISNMKRQKTKDDSLKRVNKQAILFNTREMNAINHYCKKFKVSNKSKFMRETIISEVLKKFEDNYPTLWDESQQKLF